MYAPGLLLVGVLVLVLLSQREHLTFDSTRKDIRDTRDQAEIDRIYALAPASLRSLATNSPSPNPLPTGDKAKGLVVMIVIAFQRVIYAPATAPITETVIDSWIAQVNQLLTTAPNDASTAFYKTAFSNGDAKRLVMAYMGLTPLVSDVPIPPVPGSSSSISIPAVLGQLRDTLLEYKMTGDTRYKTAYDGTKEWLDTYINGLNTQLTRDADAITNDVTQYRMADREMSQTQTDFQRIRTEGPQVENTYLTIKKQMDFLPTFDASTDAYVKLGVAGALIIGVGVLTFV